MDKKKAAHRGVQPERRRYRRQCMGGRNAAVLTVFIMLTRKVKSVIYVTKYGHKKKGCNMHPLKGEY
jgi:hypothetical protein